MNRQKLVPFALCLFISIGATSPIRQRYQVNRFCGYNEPEQFRSGNYYASKDLTYGISKYSTQFSQFDVNSILAKAFEPWSNVTDLTFTRTSRQQMGPVDIDIRFEVGDHGDGYNNAFDGPFNTLAHATYGFAHFDDAELWTTDGNPYMTNLYAVAVHEFGHSLGLHHSNVKEAIMYHEYNYDNTVMGLHSDDIQNIQALYGAKTSDNGYKYGKSSDEDDYETTTAATYHTTESRTFFAPLPTRSSSRARNSPSSGSNSPWDRNSPSIGSISPWDPASPSSGSNSPFDESRDEDDYKTTTSATYHTIEPRTFFAPLPTRSSSRARNSPSSGSNSPFVPTTPSRGSNSPSGPASNSFYWKPFPNSPTRLFTMRESYPPFSSNSPDSVGLPPIPDGYHVFKVVTYESV